MNKMVKTAIVVCTAAFAFSANAAWVDCTAGLLQGKTPAWPGGTSGCAVNRLNGDLYVRVTGLGIYKSSDQGATYTRIDGNTVTGRNEDSWAWDMDQENPARMALFSLDGDAAYTADGVTWKKWTSVWGRNWDFGSVDWRSPDAKTIIAMDHEHSGIVRRSTDGGTSWTQLSITLTTDVMSGNLMVGTMDANTFIYANSSGIQRSTDLGATWSQVSTIKVLTKTPQIFKGVAYLGSTTGLAVSSDKGATWRQQGAAMLIQQGPYFGSDENTMVVVNQQGVYKTTNAGTNWTKLPPTMAGENFEPRWFGHFAWDPVNNIVYNSKMSFATFKWALGASPVVNSMSPDVSNKGIVVTRSEVRSENLISKVEVYLPSGKLLYRQTVPGANSVALPQMAGASSAPRLYRVTLVGGGMRQICR